MSDVKNPKNSSAATYIHMALIFTRLYTHVTALCALAIVSQANASKAMGVEANHPGYEKNGSEIVALKINGSLALHCLVRGADPLVEIPA